MKSVAILGGGVGGLSAAHELAERGFEVHVYEMRDAFGGKARSIPIPGSGTDGRLDLPGEHGFRFFPGFYFHLTDTMSRISSGNKTVAQHLVPATEILMARAGKQNELIAPADLSGPDGDLAGSLRFMVGFAAEVGISPFEMAHFVRQMLTYLTSCEERRLAKWELQSWWDFIGAQSRSAKYQKYLADGMTRTLVAAQAKQMSARTGGSVLWQIIYDMIGSSTYTDRLLDGPTSEVWIDPWVEQLKKRGVHFHNNRKVTEIRCGQGHIEGVVVTEVEHIPVIAEAENIATNTATRTVTARSVPTQNFETVHADYYIAAMPVEQLDPLVTPAMREAEPRLAGLKRLITRWMNGVIFYLDRDVPLRHGHALFIDSEWALTAISQKQFWRGIDLSQRGDGTVRGILSVDVSDWFTPGRRTGKCAYECSPDEIYQEVWGQMLDHIDDGSLDRANIVHKFIDPAIEFPNPNQVTNAEPLLVNVAGSWRDRPEATTAILNLFLAADFVQTNTDLATMEAANEAARQAVNGILEAEGSTEERCEVRKLREPGVVARLRELDRLRWQLEQSVTAVAGATGDVASQVVTLVPRAIIGAVRLLF